jgi:2-amino-4-hydroxy-6-hydroxymethyldihydropteridine diphosphokinase
VKRAAAARKRKPAATKRISKRRKSSARASRPPKRKRNTEARAPRVAYLGLGSNLGNRRRNLLQALDAIARASELDRVSSFYRTEPVGFADQPDFENLVARVRWKGSAPALLALALRIERDLGRVRTFSDGPRAIDIDVLDLGGSVRRNADPILPHPRMTGRRFVLAPLAEIAPDWRHPVSGLSAREMLDKLPERPAVRRMSP